VAPLTTKARNNIASDEFALPGRRYPIQNRSHGAAAKSRVSQFGSPAEKATVGRKVAAKYPDMGKGGGLPGTPDLLGAREQYRAALQHHLGQLGPPPRSRMDPPPMGPSAPMAAPPPPMGPPGSGAPGVGGGLARGGRGGGKPREGSAAEERGESAAEEALEQRAGKGDRLPKAPKRGAILMIGIGKPPKGALMGKGGGNSTYGKNTLGDHDEDTYGTPARGRPAGKGGGKAKPREGSIAEERSESKKVEAEEQRDGQGGGRSRGSAKPRTGKSIGSLFGPSKPKPTTSPAPPIGMGLPPPGPRLGPSYPLGAGPSPMQGRPIQALPTSASGGGKARTGRR